MENLEAFIQKINEFEKLKSSEQIRFFVYYLTSCNQKKNMEKQGSI